MHCSTWESGSHLDKYKTMAYEQKGLKYPLEYHVYSKYN